MKTQKSRIGLYFFIILFCLATALFFLLPHHRLKRQASPGRETTKAELNLRRTPIVKAIEIIQPSVVNLSTNRIVNRPAAAWLTDTADGDRTTGPRPERGYSIGAGCIIDPAGLIVTSAHVVSQATEIIVTLKDGRRFRAFPVAEDVQNDIALLRIDRPRGVFSAIHGISPDDMMLGETVIAVGSPYGLDGTVTVGVLSGIGRTLLRNGKELFRDLLQTDAAVHPGNSGGPLINLSGRMIGMNMAVRRDTPGIGFAIPMLRLENTLANWMLPEFLTSVSIGIIPGMNPDGTIFIRKILPGSPAASTLLKEKMSINELNGWAPHGNLLEFLRRLVRLKAGKPFELRIGGLPNPVVITPAAIHRTDGAMFANLKLSLSLEELTPELMKALRYPFASGVIVADAPETLSACGVSRGDLLIKLGQQMIYNLNDVARVLQDSGDQPTLPATFLHLRNTSGKLDMKEIHVVFRLR